MFQRKKSSYGYENCLKCLHILVKDSDSYSVVFLDIERAEGRADSDPIQFGLVKYSYGVTGVVSEEEIMD